jgi:hypothetical protein
MTTATGPSPTELTVRNATTQDQGRQPKASRDVSRRTVLQQGSTALAGLAGLGLAGPTHAVPGPPGAVVIPRLAQPAPNPILKESTMDLKYSDGIAAARTLIALEGNAAALQRRLPRGWELAPYAGDDLRGTSLRSANMLVPLHEVYAVRSQAGQPPGLPPIGLDALTSGPHPSDGSTT